MNSKWYWLIRQKCRNLKFQIKKAAFRLNERKESSERLSSFSRIVIRTLLVQVAINLVLVAVLYVGDKLLLSAMEILAKTQTDPLIVALPESILVDIVIGGIGVAGVILGLYCSNMTSVYSSKYTNAPATISSAFQRDVVTNRCIKQITGYIIFCVIILFGCLIGISFSYVSIIALLFLTIRMIITFSITGNRMYQLSNTFNISDNLYPEIYSALRKISANNHFSNDPNFQNHYQKICTKQFKILQDIAAYNKDNTFFPKLEALHFEPTVVWDECHLKQFLTRRKEIEKRFPPYLVKCCGETTLAHWRDREDFPDSLGFCYNQLCEYLVVAIEDDDFESFKSAYSGFFGVVLLYHEYVRSDVVKIKELHKQSAVFHVVTAPLIEYAIISGLAILWGEFSENRQWKELVDAELSEFVSKDEKKREILTKIIEMLSYRKGHMLGIGNRDLIQTNWVQRITNSIRVSGLCHYEYKDWGIKVLKTESTLLKAFCGTSFENLGFADNVEDLYLILCLNQYVPSEKQYESRSKWEKNLHETDTQ